ncbi:hypothetical protein Aduo_003455 [Ancylostoma duodenale]
MFQSLLLLVAAAYVFSETIPQFYISNSELREISRTMRQVDHNKAQPEQVCLNYQGKAEGNYDNAPKPFFKWVDPQFLEKPNVKMFMAMMDNFHRKTGKTEPQVSPEEEQEEVSDFLTMALASKPWQVLYDFLEQKGHPYAEDPETFRAKIEQLWFEHYSRSKGKPDSSGFEHVFIGEEKKRVVSGLHNWIRIYFLEKNPDEEFDYKGYLDQRGKIMAALRFTWHGALKKIGSILIGTSPEFDMALYTLCFLSRRGREPCKVDIDGCQVSITSFDMIKKGKAYIGTSFPTAGRKSDTCGKVWSIRL